MKAANQQSGTFVILPVIAPVAWVCRHFLWGLRLACAHNWALSTHALFMPLGSELAPSEGQTDMLERLWESFWFYTRCAGVTLATVNLLTGCHVTFFGLKNVIKKKIKGPSTSTVMDVLVTVPGLDQRLTLQILAVSHTNKKPPRLWIKVRVCVFSYIVAFLCKEAFWVMVTMLWFTLWAKSKALGSFKSSLVLVPKKVMSDKSYGLGFDKKEGGVIVRILPANNILHHVSYFSP